MNIRPDLTVSEMAREVGLPRTTAFRILENLRDAGYVARSGKNGRYRLTIRVRRLSSGFNDEAWLTDIARPLLRDLTGDVVWPVNIATVRGTAMLLRFTTDVESPLAIDYYGEGTEVPILTTASGQVCIAYSGATERAALVATIERDDPVQWRRFGSREYLDTMVDNVRADGYSLNLRSPRTREPGKTTTVAVPIIVDGQYHASLSMRYIDSALSIAEMRDRFLPVLQDYAARIGKAFDEMHAPEPGLNEKGKL